MGKDLPVLLLDFSRSFSLLIPNIGTGKSFHSSNTTVEVLTKTLSSGQQITFMKFLFESPVLTIEAPVLSDRQMMFKVLKQNSACVLLECILTDVKKTVVTPPRPEFVQLQQHQQQQQQLQQQQQQQVEFVQPLVQTVAPQPVIVTEGSQVLVGDSYVLGVPKLPPGTILVPQNGAVHVFEPQQQQPQQQQQYFDVFPDLMDAAFVQQQPLPPQQSQTQEFVAMPGQTLVQQQPLVTDESFETNQAFIASIQPANHFSPTEASAAAMTSVIPSTSLNVLPANPVTASYPHQSPVNAAIPLVGDYSHHSPVPVPTSIRSPAMPDLSHHSPQQPQLPQTLLIAATQDQVIQPAVVSAPAPIQHEERVPRLIYPDMITESIYKALKPDELTKIECCRYCQKKFTFLSEHLAHMKVHTQDVESVSQMSINIWIQAS